jgi:CheY-like chemotaxis protein
MPASSILLVEDDPAIAMLLEEMLLDLGADSVTVEARLPGAMDAARTGAFDCVILDLKLHGQETFDVARTLGARGIPFAFFTGYGKDGLKEFAEHPRLPKPFGESDLEALMERLLGQPLARQGDR